MTSGLMVGADVFATDGRKIGLLNRVSGAYMRIEGAEVEPFWLPTDVVQSSDPAGVRVSFPSDGIDEYKLAEDDLPEDLDTGSPINPSHAPGA